jgi:alkanesulfonate monooxygenase SsuD/methylene tetrahydromethanopterin reductase-like flavin-dependent oxidoreductase (luciferase family)
VQAGASEAGRRLAARCADVVYSNAHDLESAQSYYADLKDRLAAHGRQPDELLIMPGVAPFVAATRQEVQEKYEELQALIHPLSGLAALYGQLGDLSAYPLDGPVPDLRDANTKNIGSIANNLVDVAHAENLTIRQLGQRVASTFGVRLLIGTAADIVDEMEAWFRNDAADGFNICPPILPAGMDDMSDFVVPELRRRGLFRSRYEGSTLRANLGLAPNLFKRN